MSLLSRLRLLSGATLAKGSHSGMPVAPPRFLQVLTPARAGDYLRGQAARGFLPHYVHGVFLRKDHFGPTPTARSVLRETGASWLAASGAPAEVAAPDGSLLVLLFDVDCTDELVALPREAVVPDSRPHTSPVPSFTSWYRANAPLHLLPGATILELHDDGTHTFLGRLEISEAGTWKWRMPRNARVDAALSRASSPCPPGAADEVTGRAWHRCFVDIHGWLPVEVLDGRRAMIAAADRRILRLRIGPHSEQSGVCPEGAWALVDRASVCSAFFTTRASLNGTEVTVHSMSPGSGERIVGLTSTDPWSPTFASPPWFGDEIGGFHAQIPESELTSIRVERREFGPQSLRSPFPPIEIRPNVARAPNWARDFLIDAAGAVHPVDVDPDLGTISALVPDPRAADIMFPAHGRVLSVSPAGTRIELPSQAGRLVQAHTRASLFDRGDLSAFIIGEDGVKYRYRNAVTDPAVDPMSLPPRSVDYRAVGVQIDSLVEPGSW